MFPQPSWPPPSGGSDTAPLDDRRPVVLRRRLAVGWLGTRGPGPRRRFRHVSVPTAVDTRRQEPRSSQPPLGSYDQTLGARERGEGTVRTLSESGMCESAINQAPGVGGGRCGWVGDNARGQRGPIMPSDTHPDLDTEEVLIKMLWTLTSSQGDGATVRNRSSSLRRRRERRRRHIALRP